MKDTKACPAGIPASGVLLQLGFPAGIGAVGGLIAGYTVKKISKLVAVARTGCFSAQFQVRIAK
jgi:uncharacterized membrane protein (Fun14 family)